MKHGKKASCRGVKYPAAHEGRLKNGAVGGMSAIPDSSGELVGGHPAAGVDRPHTRTEGCTRYRNLKSNLLGCSLG